MANYVKPGLTYFPAYTNRYMDVRIRKLKRQYKATGLALHDYILCEIYRDKGYYIGWDENTAFEIADYFSIGNNLVKEVVNYCCHLGLFNKELLASKSVLTSLEIQEQYVFICKVSRRKYVEISAEYSLISDSKMDEMDEDISGKIMADIGVYSSPEGNGLPKDVQESLKDVQLSGKSVQKQGENVETKTQRKEKKSKVNVFSSYPDFFDGLDTEFRPVMEKWIIYKQNRGEGYTELRALKAFHTRIMNESGGDCSIASEMIQTAIDNKWAGFFPPKKSQKTELNIEFELFWNEYDKKTADKEKCRRKWEALSDQERESIMAYVPKYKTAQPDKSFRKNPDSFLNQKAWNFEIIHANSNKNQPYNPKNTKADGRF